MIIPNDEEFTRMANDAIQKAIREGAFDDLPGKGKPFEWDEWEDPYVKPEQRAVNHILKNAGFAPQWIAQRREITELTEGARTSLARSWRWVQESGGMLDALAAEQWARALAVFRTAVDDINRLIRSHNLLLPSGLPQMFLLDAEREITQIAGE